VGHELRGVGGASAGQGANTGRGSRRRREPGAGISRQRRRMSGGGGEKNQEGPNKYLWIQEFNNSPQFFSIHTNIHE